MRILILHSRYLSGPVSGENRVVEDQARLLEEAGHDVTVWTPSAGRISMVQAGVDTVWSRSAAAEVRRMVRETRPDVVHVHNLFPMLSPSVLRATGAVPIVMTLHNFRYMCPSGTLYRDGHICEDCVGHVPWPGVVHGCYRSSTAASAAIATSLTLHRGIGSYERVTTFIALSEFMRGRHERAGLPAERIVVQTNFSWPTERRTGPGGYFLYLGRLSPEKGLSPFVRAWGRVSSPLVIVGEGPELEHLQLEASDHVEFREASRPTRCRRSCAVLVPWSCRPPGTREPLVRSSRPTRPACRCSRASSARCPRSWWRARPAPSCPRATSTPGWRRPSACRRTESASAWARPPIAAGARSTIRLEGWRRSRTCTGEP